jgi:hypothetical protein
MREIAGVGGDATEYGEPITIEDAQHLRGGFPWAGALIAATVLVCVVFAAMAWIATPLTEAVK